MPETGIASHLISIFLAALRLAPALAFAQPFTLVRIPIILRVALSLVLASVMVQAAGPAPLSAALPPEGLLALMASELLIGIIVALCLQAAFAAVLVAGRAIDIQAGFGLALLVDPASRGQMPLVGTIFAYLTAAVFFATGGMNELLGVWAMSFRVIPPGSLIGWIDVMAMAGHLSSVFFVALGLAGTVLLTLFLIDLVVAATSRTLPQVPVLLIGFQVKTLAVLLTLPLAIGLSGALYLRLIRLALEAPLRMVG